MNVIPDTGCVLEAGNKHLLVFSVIITCQWLTALSHTSLHTSPRGLLWQQLSGQEHKQGGRGKGTGSKQERVIVGLDRLIVNARSLKTVSYSFRGNVLGWCTRYLTNRKETLSTSCPTVWINRHGLAKAASKLHGCFRRGRWWRWCCPICWVWFFCKQIFDTRMY